VIRALIFTQETRPELADQFQEFRHQLFIERLGWRLASSNRREADQFDTREAVYCILVDREGILGGFRALQCSTPYLAQQVFPTLATTRPYPNNRHYWEISRFGVRDKQSEAVQLTYAVMLRFGQVRRATALVALVDLYHERLLRMLRIPTRRYGPPQIVGIDLRGRELKAVAGEIPLNSERESGIARLMVQLKKVEISDETLVFGRWALSA
jgi:N-acyl-L-homoserine lactone synthetase